ncbi:MAG: hypothetical protein AAF720_01165 [Pseudomonadota bacterium]
MLVLTSLENAQTAFAQHRPNCVVSLLSEDEETPCFRGLANDHHVKLYMDDESCATAINNAAQKRTRDLVKFINNWDRLGSIMVHCNRGVSRSAAAAFIILCALDSDTDEATIIQNLRRVAPHIDPCPLFVSYADAELSRGGKMLDALEDLGPPSPILYAPTVQLPIRIQALSA